MFSFFERLLKPTDTAERAEPPPGFIAFLSERKHPMIFYADSPWCPDLGYSMTLYFNSASFINYSNYKTTRSIS
jgi:peptide/nickel transport system substrate-binding protein